MVSAPTCSSWSASGGVDEFAGWLEKTGSELMYALNLATRGVQEALDVHDYANVPSGTELSDLRIKNGRVRPHAIKIWCLGNEDGPWQLGHRSADDYGKLASRTAKAMRAANPMPPTCPRTPNTDRRSPSLTVDSEAGIQYWTALTIDHHLALDTLVMRRSPNADTG